MKRIILITGLGSSLPFIGRIWSAWAIKLERRFNAQFKGRKDVSVIRVSADLDGEAKALDMLRKDIKKGVLDKAVVIGHSNGFRDGLRIAEAVKPAKIDYFAGIDMTLGEFGAKATNNIQLFHEFHAKLEKADFAKNFDMSKHHFWKIKKGHTAAASDTFVQDKIFFTVKGLFQ